MKRHFLLVLLAPALLIGCQIVPSEPVSPTAQSCRLLLTFDDGPSADPVANTSLEILSQLESNDIQPGIKALFFVQTRNPDGGGTALGRNILRYTHLTGHVLGLHSGTPLGHLRHTTMLPQELEQSLRDGLDDLRVITGENSAFIRPTFWGYNDETLQIYAAHGLKMLLTDVNNRDGIRLHNIFGFRDRIREQFARARQMIARGALPELHGQVPLVITLHDLNTMTAHNLAHYLHVMTEEAARTGLTLAAKPFYDDAREIAEVASLRAYPAEMVTVIAKDTRKYTLPDNTVAGAATTQNTAQPATAVPVSYNPGNTASTLR